MPFPNFHLRAEVARAPFGGALGDILEAIRGIRDDIHQIQSDARHIREDLRRSNGMLSRKVRLSVREVQLIGTLAEASRVALPDYHAILTEAEALGLETEQLHSTPAVSARDSISGGSVVSGSVSVDHVVEADVSAEEHGEGPGLVTGALSVVSAGVMSVLPSPFSLTAPAAPSLCIGEPSPGPSA